MGMVSIARIFYTHSLIYLMLEVIELVKRAYIHVLYHVLHLELNYRLAI